jgi:hypothetical protein
VHGIFAAVPYCIDLIGGPYLETDDSGVQGLQAQVAAAPPRPAAAALLDQPVQALGVELLGGVRILRHAVLGRQFARRADSFSIACHSSAIWCSWPEALSIRPFIACATGSSPCVTP